MIRGALLATAIFVAFLFMGARVSDALDAADWTWLLVCGVAGLAAGLTGARWGAGWATLIGPAVLALVFAATTNAEDELGPWLALLASVGATALGVVAGQRRR